MRPSTGISVQAATRKTFLEPQVSSGPRSTHCPDNVGYTGLLDLCNNPAVSALPPASAEITAVSSTWPALSQGLPAPLEGGPHSKRNSKRLESPWHKLRQYWVRFGGGHVSHLSFYKDIHFSFIFLFLFFYLASYLSLC